VRKARTRRAEGQAGGAGELWGAGDEADAPPAEALAQHAAERRMERTERGGVAEPRSIGRVDHHEPGRRRGRRREVGDHAFGEPRDPGDTGPLRVRARRGDGARIAIAPAKPVRRGLRAGGRVAHRLPGVGVEGGQGFEGEATHPARRRRSTGRLLIDQEALDRLQALRDALGKPLIVRSAYRSTEHNRTVGGATRSKHLDGAAFDIAMANHDPVAFEAAAREVGFLGFGFYPRSGFMHIDLGPARQWGERFPARPVRFAAETPPAREVLAQSRTMKGGGAAGVATLGAAGVEVAQQVLAETQTAILPLVPYLDTLRWVFIAVALGGIAVTIYARLDDWKRGRR